jgi:hypothetical protein
MDFAEIDPVAIYAAIVSTVALGWQILKERRARRPLVEVQIRWAAMTFPIRGLSAWHTSRRGTAVTCRSGSPRPGSTCRPAAGTCSRSPTSQPGRRYPV